MSVLRRLLSSCAALVALVGITGTSALAQSTAITIEPDTLDFVRVQGGSFAEAGFTITNVGADTVTGSVQNSTGVFQTMQGGGVFTLAAGDSLEVLVRFTPSAAQIFSDSLAINYTVDDSSYVAYVYTLGAGADVGSVVVEIPDSVDFGSVAVGQTATTTIQIINNSDSARFVGLVGSLSGAFSAEVGAESISIDAGDTLDLELTFAPTEAGPAVDSLVITYVSDFAIETATVVLTGVGVAGSVVDTVDVMVTPEALVFGNVHVGATSTQTVYVTNTSDSARLVGTVVAGGGAFTVVSGGGAFSLAAGESRAITVRFAPTAELTYSDSLMIVYAGTGGITDTASVSLTGVGTAVTTPVVGVSVQPSVVTFGSVVVGDNSMRTVTITNTSDVAIVAGTIAPTGLGAAFSIESGTGAFTLAPGQSHTVALEFAPTATGLAIDSLSIVFAGGLGLETQVVTLVGAGIEAASTGGGIALSTSTLAFGSTTVGSTMQQQLTITNPSASTTLTGTILNPSAPFFVDGAAGPFTLAPGETRTVTVVYTPVVAGTFSDNLVIAFANGDSTGTALVHLTGSASIVSGIASERAVRSMLSIASYPEPARDRATISYASERGGHVRIAIVDARGREVARPLDAVVDAGAHTIEWSTESMPAGVYIVTMRSVGETTSRRITVVR